MVKIKKYENGSTLISQTDKRTKYSSFCLFVDVGAQDEKENEYGVAHFLEHIFFKSTKKMQTSDISKHLESLGAYINAQTGLERTQYVFRCLTENLEPCLKMYAEMFYEGKFDKEEIDKERSVVLEEIKRSQDNSQQTAYLNGQLSLFHNQPFGHKVLGTEEVIKNISIEEIKSFKKRTYKPNNIYFSVYSNENFEKINSLIEKYFKTGPEKLNIKKENTKEKVTLNPKQKYVIQEKNDKQVNLYALIKTSGYMEKQKVDKTLLYSAILGGGLSSRMFIELREKLGLAYSAGAGLNIFKNCGFLAMYIATSPEKVKTALTGMKLILKDLAEDGISNDELQKVKNKEKSNIIFHQDNKLNIACTNARSFSIFGKIKSLKQRIKRFDKITVEDINKIAKEIYNEDKIVVSAVGKGFSPEDLNF